MIKDYPKYEISNKGRVKNIELNKLVNPYVRNYYMCVGLYKDRKQYKIEVHRLVAIEFLENKKGLPLVNHKDGNKLNNNLENLEWSTSSQNTKHAHENGLISGGGGHKTKIEQIDPKTNNIIKIWDSFGEVKEYLNISEYRLRKIIENNTVEKDSMWKKHIEEELSGETWRKIKDYNNYEVSNYGRIRTITKMLLKPKKSTYLCIVLTDKEGNQKNFCIHVLVARAFIKNPENKPKVNHKDANKYNNHVDNLEWATLSENTQHAVKIGKIRSKAILQYDLKGKLIKEYPSIISCANELKLSRLSIWYVLNGKADKIGDFKFKYKDSNIIDEIKNNNIHDLDIKKELNGDNNKDNKIIIVKGKKK